jgi:hypothetical protein
MKENSQVSPFASLAQRFDLLACNTHSNFRVAVSDFRLV